MIKELIEYVVKQLANKPDQVRVTEVKDGDRHLFEITVDEQDRGKVIGRNGQTIKAMRTLVNVAAPEGKRITVDLAK